MQDTTYKLSWILFSWKNCHAPTRKGSIRGNRRVPLNGSQFPETHSRTRKAQDILARLNNDKLPFPSDYLNFENRLTIEDFAENSAELRLKHGLPPAQ